MFYDSGCKATHSNVERYADALCKFFKDKKGWLAVSGTSGLSLGMLVSIRLKMGMYYIRKESEKSHGGRIEFLEGKEEEARIVWILDDFVHSGATVKRIIKGVKEYLGDGVKFEGIVTYMSEMNSRDCVERIKVIEVSR